MKTPITGYKFFKKGECKISGNSVSDDRGFTFEEGKELSVNFDKELKEDKLLPMHSSGSIINSAIFQKGIRFNQLPTNQYQYFPYCGGGQYEDFCFEVITLGYWFNHKPYRSSLICAESIKILRKLTGEEVNKIKREWNYDRTKEREEREKKRNISPKKFEDLIGKTIHSAIRYKLKDIPNDAGYLELKFTDGTKCFLLANYIGNGQETNFATLINIISDLDISKIEKTDAPLTKFATT